MQKSTWVGIEALSERGEGELSSGIDQVDRFSDRGRRSTEERLPNLSADIKAIVEPESQTDPTFRSTRKYTPVTAKEVRSRLNGSGKYQKAELPSSRTIARILNDLGFHPTKPAKCKPLKRIDETDAIFEEVHRINNEADSDPEQLRISLDTKAVVKVGDYARSGKSRQNEKALDHDFNPEQKVTPFGIFLPETNDTFLWMATSKVTADFMVDRLEEIMPELRNRCPLRVSAVNDGGAFPINEG